MENDNNNLNIEKNKEYTQNLEKINKHIEEK